MFYSQFVLAKKGPLGKIWLAAHMEKKVPKVQIIATNIPESVDNIENPKVPMALRVSGHLLLGVVRIFSRKVSYLLTDCSEALVKIKNSFPAAGTVDLPQGATTRRFDDITNPDHFDEMDLEADLASQPMNFTMADDALEGIQLPDVDDLGEPEALQWRADATDPLAEKEEGLGANPNFQDFFEDQVHEPPPSQKRRRASGPDPDEVMLHDEMFRDPDNEVEVEGLRREDEEDEVFRSADNISQPPSRGLVGMEGTRDLDPQEDDLVEKPVFDEGQEDDFPAMQEPPEEPLKQPGLLDDVMETDVAQPSAKAMESDVSRVSSEPAVRRPSKRKMVLDKQLQISPEQMREQLEDASAIVRDIGDAPVSSNSRAEASFNPFTGPPSLAFLPASVADMRCFQTDVKAPSAKRARKLREEVQPEPEMEEEEQWRSQDSHLEPEVAPVALLGGQSDDIMAEETAPEDEKTHFDVPDEPEDMPFFEEPQIDHPDIEAFEASRALPEVDAGESVAVSRDTPGKGKKKGSVPDAEAWSKRTHNMYVMLGEAFKESGNQPLSYDAMIAQTSGKNKRKVVAGCFQELLFLSTHGLIDLEQQRPYSNIVVSKTEAFGNVKVH